MGNLTSTQAQTPNASPHPQAHHHASSSSSSSSSPSTPSPSSPPLPSSSNHSPQGIRAPSQGLPIKSPYKLHEGHMFGSPLNTPVPSSFRGSLEDESRATFPAVINWNQGGKDVKIQGAFNNWGDTIPLSRSQDDFTTVLNLKAGTHVFKFVVDGEERCSSDFPTVLDAQGNLMNYIEVGQEEDFKIEEEDMPMEGEEGFSQTVPSDLSTQEPPRLPPHLTKVILNSENISNDPSLLPIPHHVMLNHLYALSIRDRVMVLATTTRYRKKYVTTVLYKPVFS